MLMNSAEVIEGINMELCVLSFKIIFHCVGASSV